MANGKVTVKNVGGVGICFKPLITHQLLRAWKTKVLLQRMWRRRVFGLPSNPTLVYVIMEKTRGGAKSASRRGMVSDLFTCPHRDQEPKAEPDPTAIQATRRVRSVPKRKRRVQEIDDGACDQEYEN